MAARTAARNLSAISLHKGAQIAGAFAFAALIPRFLGPQLFGQLSFALSLSLLLQMAGDLGGLDIIGRYVPAWAQQGHQGQQHIAWLVWQLSWVRLLIGIIVTLALALTAPWLTPWLTRPQGILIGLGVALRILSWTPYHLSFGLNHMGRWSVDLSWRQLIMIPCLLAGLPWGLTGLLIGLLVTEIVFLIPALLWARPHLHPQPFDHALRQAQDRPFDWRGLRPYLRFGAGFFLANVVVVLLYRSGSVLLELITHDTVAVGYLSLALSLYMLLITVLTQYMSAFVPTLALFHSRQQHRESRRWLDRLMRYSAALIGIVLIGIATLTYPVAAGLFGSDFQPVGRIFLILGLALVAQPLIWAGRSAAAAFGHPRAAFIAMLVGFIANLVAGILLIPTLHADGAALALLAGALCLSLTLLLLSRSWLHPPWRAWLITFLPLLALVPLLNPSRPLLPALGLAALLIPTYLVLLWRARVLPTHELGQTLAAFRPL